jgi:DNA-binding CsgD family transcriptional regulator
MVAEYTAGATASSLAVKYGVHEGTVRSHARKVGAGRPDKVTSKVLDEYASGTPAAVLAERCSLSVDTIIRHARLAGITSPGRTKTLPRVRVDQIVESYARGEQIVTIARRLGRGHRYVRAVLVAAGVTIRPKGHPPMPANKAEEITRLRREGWSFARIGAQVGASASTVRAACVNHQTE